MLSGVDPFSGERGPTIPGGTIPERCSFWYETARVVADTQYENDHPQIYYYCKRSPAPDPGLFEPIEGSVEEGAPTEVVQTVYERCPALREMCIRIHGVRCVICNTNFEDTYGATAAGFIHVHHLEPLGAAGQAHAVKPETDLIPVCPNCHSVIHLQTPPFSPDEVRTMLNRSDKERKKKK